MKLITELREDVEYITEAREDGKKDHYITGPFLEYNVLNRNGRNYPQPVMESAVRKYIEENINNSRGYGELGHPSGPGINLDRVSHMIVELKHDAKGKSYIGKAKIASNTVAGGIAKGLLETGFKLGVSSRGLGSLIEKNGIMEVQPDFHLATAADIVADPSAPNAFVKGIMENHEWIYDPIKGLWQEELIYETKKELKKMRMDDIDKKKIAIFEGFISSLSSNISVKTKLI